MLDSIKADTCRPRRTRAQAADELLRCTVFTSHTRSQQVESSGFKFT